MDTSLEWKRVVSQKIFTCGHRMVGGEEEDRFMRNRNIKEDMAEERHILHLAGLTALGCIDPNNN